MAQTTGTHYLPLILAYLATLFYIAAMCTPWWYTKYGPADDNLSEAQFYDNNPAIDQDMGLFDRTNCFIDGSCITGDTIYKNNSTLQWVYTTVLILMIVGWVPWLIFVHLLHSRVGAHRTPMKGRRFFMIVTAILTMLMIIAAVIVFAVGMVKGNGVYNAGGLYGSLNVLNNNGLTGTGTNDLDNTVTKRQVIDNNGNPATSSGFGYNGMDDSTGRLDPVVFGTLPYGGSGMRLLGAGMSVILNVAPSNVTGVLRYKYGAHSAWYFALIALPVMLISLIIGLAVKTDVRQTTQTRAVTTSRPPVNYIPQPVAYAPAANEQELAYMGSAPSAPVLRDSTPLTRRVGNGYTAAE